MADSLIRYRSDAFHHSASGWDSMGRSVPPAGSKAATLSWPFRTRTQMSDGKDFRSGSNC
jgi:hypothetical protein